MFYRFSLHSISITAGFKDRLGFKFDLRVWSEDRSRFPLKFRARAEGVLRFGMSGWMRSGAAVRFRTVEGRNGGRRRNGEGCRREGRRSSCGFLLPKGRYHNPPFFLHSSTLLLLLDPQQGDINVTWWMLVLKDGNQFRSRIHQCLSRER